MQIIKAQKKHVPQLVVMWKEFMVYHARIDRFFDIIPGALRYYKKHLLKTIRGRRKTMLVAVEGKEILGVCELELDKNAPIFKTKKFGFIAQLYVRQKYQRKGIGAALVNSGIEWFRKKGINRVELLFLPGNLKGSNFWIKKTGFKTFRCVAYRNI